MNSEGKKKWNVGKMFSFLSKMSSRSKLILFGAIALVFTFAFPIASMVSGNSFGTAVGTAVGSYYAATVDMPAAYSQGVEDGLSAKDVRTSIENAIRDVGKLDVLAANATLTDLHKDGESYAAIYSFGADVIFSVDISQAVVYSGDNQYIIKVPAPVAVINIDSTKTRLEAEYKRFLLDGSTENGIDAYLNSLKAIQGDAATSLQDYAYLEGQAKASAEKQIRMLYESITGNANVEVQFAETAGEK